MGLSAILDLTRQEAWASLGTSLQDLTGSWLGSSPGVAPTQHLGQGCYEVGTIEALKVPSAKDPKAFNLAVFPDRLREESYLRVYDDSGLIDARLPS